MNTLYADKNKNEPLISRQSFIKMISHIYTYGRAYTLSIFSMQFGQDAKRYVA